MTKSLVQSQEFDVGAGSPTAIGAYPSANASGNLLVLLAISPGTNSSPAPLSSISDSQGNTWTRAVSSPGPSAGRAEIWYCLNAAAGSNTVTITLTGSAPCAWSFEIREYNEDTGGMWALDKTGSNGVTSSTTIAASTSTLANPSEVVVALAGIANGAASTDISTVSGGPASINHNHSGSGADYNGAGEIVSATSAVSATFTWNASHAYQAAIATFRMTTQAYSQTISESLPAISEILARAIGRLLAQSLPTLTESLTTVKGITRTATSSESLPALIDSTTGLLARGRIVAESLPVISSSIVRNLSLGISLNLPVIADAAHRGIYRSIVDALSLPVDSAIAGKLFAQSIGEVLPVIQDGAGRAFTRLINESLPILATLVASSRHMYRGVSEAIPPVSDGIPARIRGLVRLVGF